MSNGNKCTGCGDMFAVVSPNSGRCQRCINRANDAKLLAELYEHDANDTLGEVLDIPEVVEVESNG